MFGVLAADVVTRRAVAPGEPFALPAAFGVELFIVPGKVPLYLEGDDPALAAETGANVGVEVTLTATAAVYVPGAAAVTPALRERLDARRRVLFDGTLFTDDEMIATGTGDKTGRRMGHMPIDGAGRLARGARRACAAGASYIHINNTNPILIEGSPQRRKVEAAGWEVAEDGMEIVL